MIRRPFLSIIVPALDEAQGIGSTLAPLQPLRRRGCEVIVCDGGSEDGTVAIAAPLADAVMRAPRGRARQMNAGAARAAGRVLLFLHADTVLPEGAEALIEAGLREGQACWGRFDVSLSGKRPLLRVVEWLMNVRSRVTGIATGDQGIFVLREAFEAAGGYPDIPLMEDIVLSRRLKRFGRPLCLRPRAISSSRRWEVHGVVRTILLMWALRFLYAVGADPGLLARLYAREPLWKRSSA